MGTIDELADLLEVAGRLLSEASRTVRDLPLEPVPGNLRAIGEAMAKIYDVQRAIFSLRPDLEPAFLRESSPSPEANRRLTAALGEAYRLAREGSYAEASAYLRSFAANEGSEMHKRIAIAEAESMEKQGKQ